jgi:glyoxylase-like metal-dependent hydrolase (beta-lactamase superfamily II)
MTPAGNTTVQMGPEGIVLIDTQSEAMAPRILAEVRKLSDKPVLYIINTSLDAKNTAGNAALVKLGATPASPAAPATVAHENVFNRMSNDKNVSPPNWPTIEYYLPNKDFFVNGEAVVLTHMPNAHTDGDSVVFFRRSDVLVLGDLFSPDQYPAINLAAGGSINGLIDAMNKILSITVTGRMQEGGTKVIPGRGRICEEAEVVEYRDMLTIVRGRVQDMITRKMTLDQVKAARPTSDYDAEYSADPGAANTFVEAVFQSLSAGKAR